MKTFPKGMRNWLNRGLIFPKGVTRGKTTGSLWTFVPLRVPQEGLKPTPNIPLGKGIFPNGVRGETPIETHP